MNGTAKDKEIHDKYTREMKAKRLLSEMEFHTTMQIDTVTTVMRVTGGWIYYRWSEPYGTTTGVFVPERL